MCWWDVLLDRVTELELTWKMSRLDRFMLFFAGLLDVTEKSWLTEFLWSGH